MKVNPSGAARNLAKPKNSQTDLIEDEIAS